LELSSAALAQKKRLSSGTREERDEKTVTNGGMKSTVTIETETTGETIADEMTVMTVMTATTTAADIRRGTGDNDWRIDTSRNDCNDFLGLDLMKFYVKAVRISSKDSSWFSVRLQ
jgi:hypothetical protein